MIYFKLNAYNTTGIETAVALGSIPADVKLHNSAALVLPAAICCETFLFIDFIVARQNASHPSTNDHMANYLIIIFIYI